MEYIDCFWINEFKVSRLAKSGWRDDEYEAFHLSLTSDLLFKAVRVVLCSSVSSIKSSEL